MSNSCNSLFDQKISHLAREIILWNSRINLVSRIETKTRVQELITQCRQGWDLVREALEGRPFFRTGLYIDVGSGAGLPGLVWAAMRQSEGHTGRSLLVEPRIKRAWFLKRMVRLLHLPGVEVSEERWGAAGTVLFGAADPTLMVSLKAVGLDDQKVLEGACAASWSENGKGAPPSEVVILRFLAPEAGKGHWRADGNIPDGREPSDIQALGYRREEAEILGSGAPRLGLVRFVNVDRGDVPRGTSG